MVPPGEFTNMGFFMARKGMLCTLTKAYEIKDCDAPESKRTVAKVELTLNVPSITSGASCAVSVDTWFTLLVLDGAWYLCFWLLF